MDCLSSSKQEELANTIIHGLGVLIIVAATPFLLLEASSHDTLDMVIAAAIFSFTMLACYLASTLYHGLQKPRIKKVCHIADHISIFFLIGGTYTPVVIKFTPESIAIPFLSIMWSLIIAGGILKVFLTGKYDWLFTFFYLLLGWMILFIIEPISNTMPPHIFKWIIGGGIVYTIGVIFYKLRNVRFAHSIWHCFTLGGTLMHFFAIYQSMEIAVRY